MLMGYGNLNLPYDVVASEFLTMEGKRFSTSRGFAVWLPDYFSRYEADPLRYYLMINGPETSDTDFNWAEFLRRNNDELVATWGNLAHRVLTFTHKNFGAVPEPGELQEIDRAMLAQAEAAFETVGASLEGAHFRAAITEAMSLAQSANQYLDQTAPWQTIKTDRAAAAPLALCGAARDRQPEDSVLPVPAAFVTEAARVPGLRRLHCRPPGIPSGDRGKRQDAPRADLRTVNVGGKVGTEQARAGTSAAQAGAAVQEA